MEKVNVLWTGGWDSTFRILQLSRKQVEIQPYYLKDNRASERIELDTIANISTQIRNSSSTKGVLKELISVNVSDIKKDEKITHAYKRLFDSYKKRTGKNLGSQYEWLARFSKDVGVLELSIEKDTNPIIAIKAFGGTKVVNDPIIGMFYAVDEAISHPDLITVLGSYHYPLIDYTKEMMKGEATDGGYLALMNTTWFCHHPINNQPCGLCNPCGSTIKEGFEYRFPPAALRRNRLNARLEPIRNTLAYRAFIKIYRILSK